MSVLAQMQALAAQAAETGPDMNEAVAGGGGSKLLPEGHKMARLVEVVEYGSHPGEYQGKAKDPAPVLRLGFALWGEGVQEDDGSPYILRTYDITVSRNEKAQAFKLFKKLNYKGLAKNFAQLIGEAYLVPTVNKAPKADPTKLSTRIDLADIRPPIDALSKQPYPIPAAPDSVYKMFLWDYPTLEGWGALFIDGKRDDGTSKNYIQEEILSATDFQGSPLHQLLVQNNIAFTIPAPKVKAAPVAPPAAAAPAAPPAPPAAPVVAPAAPVVVAAPVVTAPVVQPTAAPVVVAPPAAPVVSMPAVPALPVQ